MRRFLALAMLAVLVSLSTGASALAADPGLVPVDPGPTTEPTPGTEPTPEPDPTPDGEPTPGTDPTPVADPSTSPDTDPAETPATTDDPAASDALGVPDPSGRFIVMLASNTTPATVVQRHAVRDKIKADRSFTRALRGFTTKLTGSQRRALEADPSVLAVVPDEVIQLTAQTLPTGVSRVGAASSAVAAINGNDDRVDADVAIIDTGIANHVDLNIAGGYNCSTSDRDLWRDVEGHGTHVAGTVGALDNSIGVVGVAPGVRLWAVKILNDDGYGLLSWYICGLDWVLAQRDPDDSSKPLIEAVNMSVAKSGRDDANCGLTNDDPLHAAICRVVAGGITVVAAAANDSGSAAARVPAAYNEVITVSALADTDGKPGGLGGNRCYSWGGYDKDDTFADFSNYGSDIDIIAPGKCIWSTRPGNSYAYLSGTSMAAPTVTGAAALYKESRPNATPAEVKEALQYLGNLGWKTSTDPDSYHEKLLDVSRLGSLGTFSIAAGTGARTEAGGVAAVPFVLTRSSTFFERVRFSVTNLPSGWSAGGTTSLLGWTANSGAVAVNVPVGTPVGTYTVRVVATNQGRTDTANVSVQVASDTPTAKAPVSLVYSATTASSSGVTLRVTWPAATDPSSAIAGYEVQSSTNGGGWGSTVATSASVRQISKAIGLAGNSYKFRVRARDAAGNWSPWVEALEPTRIYFVDDRSSSISYTSGWARKSYRFAMNTTLTASSRVGARVSMTFTGRGIAVVMPRSTKRGSVDVYVDGKYAATVVTRWTPSRNRQVIFAKGFGTTGTHTIQVRVRSGNRYPLVEFDGFLVDK